MLATVTDDQRVAAATAAGYSAGIVAAALGGRLTFHRALAFGRQRGLLSRPETAEARAKGLVR